MEKRSLGRSGLEVTTLTLGGNVFGWTADKEQSFAVLDAYVAAGGNFIDTAEVYSKWAPGNPGGVSETIIGQWHKARGNRDKIIITTKVAYQTPKGLSRQYIQQAVEASLRRLQTDYIDLYQSHSDDKETPLEETLETYAELIKQGKVRAIGASNYSAERLAEALRVSEQHGYPRYESLEPLYNLYERASYEQGLEKVCREQGLGVISYLALASGFLTGKYRSEADLNKSARGGSIKEYLNPRGFRILQALDEVAKEYNATPAQISLAWLIARPSITSPIASATSVEQLEQLTRATELKLDAAAIARLDQASAEDSVKA
ncbi:aldo/keto reductase [Ktedonosporobacter rubrisoli]|uniref:Aldo/keto reductase n=1 Tax=Ktedonosporobacter rubrisoli TaxID=2509675 RepID=A0A4P6K0M2_KTERU|nr:aldo/keto reductase [Ktedonosporobacter rubrisoli]QBD80946.1 aldo/keto reductase [Ktedonosporobacter rubrisoli]